MSSSNLLEDFLKFVRDNKVDKIKDVSLVHGNPYFDFCDTCLFVECDCSNTEEWKQFAMDLKKKMREKGLIDLAGMTIVICHDCLKKNQADTQDRLIIKDGCL